MFLKSKKSKNELNKKQQEKKFENKKNQDIIVNHSV